MNLVNKGRVGRDIRLCTFGTVAFRFVILVRFVFLLVVTQLCRDIEHDVSGVVDLMTSFGKTLDRVRQIQRYALPAIDLVAVDEFDGIVAGDGAGG